MKTIKQLEKELKIFRENKGNLGESARIVTFRYLEGRLDSLKDVLKEIDNWKNSLFKIVDYHKNHGDNSIIVRAELIKKIEELKAKLVGE